MARQAPVSGPRSNRDDIMMPPTRMPAEPESPAAIAITGAAGALGAHLIRRARRSGATSVRALVHRTSLPADVADDRVTECRGSILDPASLDRWLEPGCTVIHLAYAPSMPEAEQRRAIEALADACLRRGVRSIVHCSTAVVAGRTRSRVVTEDTRCEPATPYERTKHAIEETLEMRTRGRVPVVIARPTAIFGPGLKNLVSLADAVTRGGIPSYLRASLFGERHLHLLPVDTVVGALMFLAANAPTLADAEPCAPRFIVSADTEPGGDFRTVERQLRRGLGVASAPPRLPVPAAALRIALRLAGRSDADPARIYDGSKLARAGFTGVVPLQAAIDEFAAWYRGQTIGPAR